MHKHGSGNTALYQTQCHISFIFPPEAKNTAESKWEKVRYDHYDEGVHDSPVSLQAYIFKNEVVAEEHET